MKRMSRIICTLAALLMSLGAVTSAQAVVLTVSPNNTPFTNPGGAVVTIPGLPSWFQGADGVAIGPCLDVARCALIGSPDFNAALPMSFPTNFPSESFYTLADANFTMAGASDVLVIMALEYVFVDANGTLVAPTVPGAVGSVFQRLRVIHTFTGGGGSLAALGIPATGSFTVTTPWGTTVFPPSSIKCVNSGGDTKCSMVRDVPPTAVFTAPDSGMYTFLHDPAAPLGFLGTAAAVVSYTGAPAGHLNSVSVTDPLNRIGTSAQLSTLTGQTIGMDVQPGVNHAFGAVNMITPPAVPPKRTITITNTTGFPVTFATALAATGADPLDFILSPPTQPAAPAAAIAPCTAGTTLTANNATLGTVAGVCGFDITFTPLAAAKAARVASILLAPTAAITTNNPPAVTLSLTGTATVTVTTALASTHGTIAPDATAVPVPGSLVDFEAPAGSPVIFTVTPSNKKFKVKGVADSLALPLTLSPTDPTAFTLTDTGLVNQTITANFMQSGDLDADGFVNVADAMKALRIVAGVQLADVDDPNNTAVKVAPLDAAGQPAALDAKVTPDIGDVLVILRRALNLDKW